MTTVCSLVLSVSSVHHLIHYPILIRTHDLMLDIGSMSAPSRAAKDGVPGSIISAAPSIPSSPRN
jgi:hypothetical protein